MTKTGICCLNSEGERKREKCQYEGFNFYSKAISERSANHSLYYAFHALSRNIRAKKRILHILLHSRNVSSARKHQEWRVNERPKFRLKSPPRRKGKLKNARVTKRELNRHRAKESSPNNCAKRAIKGAKNLGMELSLTFKLSVRHIVCVCVPTAQIFVKS